MKTLLPSVVVFALVASAAACSSRIEYVPLPDPPVAQETPAADAGVDAPETPTCGIHVPEVSCSTTTPAPTSSSAIAKFIEESALPIRCEGGQDGIWDPEPLVELFGDDKIFMIGEVHGTNEIGIVSSVVFEKLASSKKIDILAVELPMEYEEDFQRWIDTGKGSLVEGLLDAFEPNFFGVILPKAARAQAEKGNKIRFAAVDSPRDPAYPIAQLQALANHLTTHRDTVLATLPSTNASLSELDAYFDHIMANRTAICTELTQEQCEHLVAMTYALWVAGSMFDNGLEDLWFARREEVIYYNMHRKMKQPTDRMFMHMGAAHTNKYADSGGSRMAKEYPLTMGRVFSVAPAYGSGSVISYGGQHFDLPGEPTTIVRAMGDDPGQPFFVSTTRPNASCQRNPLGEEPEDINRGGGSRAETYDGYIHYGKLTPEDRPYDTKLPTLEAATPSSGKNAAAAALAAHMARVHAREAAALAKRARRH